MLEPATERCFLLTRNYRDTPDNFEIQLFAKNETGIPVQILITDFRPLFFVPQSLSTEYTSLAVERRKLSMKTFDGQPVDCVYFKTLRDQQQCAYNLRTHLLPVFESDIHPVERFLMERSVFGGFEAVGDLQRRGIHLFMKNPRIRGITVDIQMNICSIDIETDASHTTVYSIACAGKKERVFIQGKGNDTDIITICQNETEVLQQFLQYLTTEDPDILIGWNVTDFDLRVLFERYTAHGIPFCAGRGNYQSSRSMIMGTGNRTIARINGRVIIDVPILLRSYYHAFEEYSLNHVASVLLNKTKDIELVGTEKTSEIDRLFSTDTQGLARYNLKDALLTREIFDLTQLLPNAIEHTRHSGHLLDRTGGSIAAFDYLYLPRLHRAGYVAPDVADADISEASLPGGYVIEPTPGLYDNVLVLDFRSLYPSIITSFFIDPLGLRIPSTERVKGPCGPSFAREPALLPGIIHELLSARNKAKRNHNVCLSQAIKILMNSFYGVLGARNCRFFSSELATAITQTGQYILKQSINYIETKMSLPVIYGDTDSLFVHLGKNHDQDADAIGNKIASEVTTWLTHLLQNNYQTESALLLEYETHFRHFLIPSVRGTSQGSKKHYCGGTYNEDILTLHFKGMESVRSDWTDCAKEFQHELIRRIFSGLPIEQYILSTVSAVKKGLMDDKLIYKKQLRKPISEYTQAIPPHVQAAKLLGYQPHRIKYCITIDGPQPVEKMTSPLDYHHYIDCQLQPVADSVLELQGKSFSTLTSGQQELFQ